MKVSFHCLTDDSDYLVTIVHHGAASPSSFKLFRSRGWKLSFLEILDICIWDPGFSADHYVICAMSYFFLRIRQSSACFDAWLGIHDTTILFHIPIIIGVSVFINSSLLNGSIVLAEFRCSEANCWKAIPNFRHLDLERNDLQG